MHHLDSPKHHPSASPSHPQLQPQVCWVPLLLPSPNPLSRHSLPSHPAPFSPQGGGVQAHPTAGPCTYTMRPKPQICDKPGSPQPQNCLQTSRGAEPSKATSRLLLQEVPSQAKPPQRSGDPRNCAQGGTSFHLNSAFPTQQDPGPQTGGGAPAALVLRKPGDVDTWGLSLHRPPRTPEEVNRVSDPGFAWASLQTLKSYCSHRGEVSSSLNHSSLGLLPLQAPL